MKDEHVIINKTQLLKRIEELSFIGKSQGLTEYQFAEKSVTENIISQSTPLIPEIEKAFDAGIDFISDTSDFPMGDAKKKDSLSKEDYISNLKLDI